jgi:DNA polymerase-4
VTLKLKCADFRALTRQDRLASPTSLAETIYRHGEAMLVGMLERAPFRLIGIGISDLAQTDGAAAPPTDLFEADQTAGRRAEAATDEIRTRFGKDAIIRGRALR